MPPSTFTIIAPAFNLPPHSDAEAFGSATWLWMHGSKQRNLPLAALDQVLLPAITRGQYAMVMEHLPSGTRPVAYLGWANLSAEAEARYVHSPLNGLGSDDWNSGDRTWFIDFFAPFGHSKLLHTLLKTPMAGFSARYMYHRSHERGVRVLTFTGARVDPTYARQWWADRPMLAAPVTRTAPL